MEVTLRGSSPGAATAGIMLLTRARQLGLPIRVEIIGDPEDIATVPGPAVVYAPVLASCGVGREHGSGATVVVSGPPGMPVLTTVTPHGMDGWFPVDRTGAGAHPASRAFVSLSRDSRGAARELGKVVRRVMTALGLSTDPAVLDVLFGAQVPPLTRLSVALRAGRALSGGRGQPITRYIVGDVDVEADPLAGDCDQAEFMACLEGGALQWVLDGLSTAIRDQAEDFVRQFVELAREDGGTHLPLLQAVAELASHLVLLPPQSILPPLGAAEDSVAVGLKGAMGAYGDDDANQQLARIYRFLGGRYVAEAEHAWDVASDPPPADHVERWQWFCSQVRRARKQSDAMWPNIVDPPQ